MPVLPMITVALAAGVDGDQVRRRGIGPYRSPEGPSNARLASTGVPTGPMVENPALVLSIRTSVTLPTSLP